MIGHQASREAGTLSFLCMDSSRSEESLLGTAAHEKGVTSVALSSWSH